MDELAIMVIYVHSNQYWSHNLTLLKMYLFVDHKMWTCLDNIYTKRPRMTWLHYSLALFFNCVIQYKLLYTLYVDIRGILRFHIHIYLGLYKPPTDRICDIVGLPMATRDRVPWPWHRGKLRLQLRPGRRSDHNWRLATISVSPPPRSLILPVYWREVCLIIIVYSAAIWNPLQALSYSTLRPCRVVYVSWYV